MAVDRSEVAEEASGQPEQASAPSSAEEKREQEHSFFNRTIRGVASAVRGALFALDGPDEPDAEKPAEEKPEQPPGITEAEAAERERRAAQSERDRLQAQQRWDEAVAAADQDDPRLLTELAEQGNQRAERELERRGLTYELGQVRSSHLREADRTQEQDGLIKTVATHFDEAILHPLLSALPEDERAKILGPDGVAGLEGRKSVAEAAVKAIQRRAATELLSNEKFVRQLLGTDSAFRKEMLRNPTTNKSLRALFRGELDEPELLRGFEAEYGGQKESDVMNAAIRGAARAADDRAPSERAAGAGRGPRGQHRDTLEDDE